jgi:phosphoribosylformimino-5-aminoimidazole carboxamide ribotide isomerase
MQIIPVIDLKDGLVVHAVRGNREYYQPIHQNSQLTDSSDIHTVLSRFLQLYPFKQFYIADLNAISGFGSHQVLIDDVQQSYPDIHFWLDNGCQFSEIKPGRPNLQQVIGTESQQLPPTVTTKDYILSLDYKDQQRKGPAVWFEQSAYWPDVVIAMTLNQVGSDSGPDKEKLIQLQRAHPKKKWVAAGGVRNQSDLVWLEKNGIHSALLATALHNGSINKQILQSL